MEPDALIVSVVVSSVSGALGGAGASAIFRWLSAGDRRRDLLLQAITATELGQKSTLDWFYCRAIGDEAAAVRMKAHVELRPYPEAHADYLGSDRDRVLQLLAGVAKATDLAGAFPLWVEAHQLISGRMSQQRRLAEAGKPLDRPSIPNPTGPLQGADPPTDEPRKG